MCIDARWRAAWGWLSLGALSIRGLWAKWTVWRRGAVIVEQPILNLRPVAWRRQGLSAIHGLDHRAAEVWG